MADLDDEERRVMLDHGTERPFCGIFNEAKDKGTYGCRLCGLPLFKSGAKFESGTGWPSFFDPIDREHVAFVRDTQLRHGPHRDPLRALRGPSRPRIPDGPPPTGERYCMNSVSMRFVAEGDPLPDDLGRGAPEGEVAGLKPAPCEAGFCDRRGTCRQVERTRASDATADLPGFYGDLPVFDSFGI